MTSKYSVALFLLLPAPNWLSFIHFKLDALIVIATFVAILAIGSVVAEPKGQCPERGIVTLPHKKSCTKYYMCFDGKPVQQRCADGLLYDHRQQNCQLEKEAQCELDVCPVDDVGTIQMVPHPENCSKYFACTRGHGFQLSCSGDLLFNRKTGSCDIPENVKHCVSHSLGPFDLGAFSICNGLMYICAGFWRGANWSAANALPSQRRVENATPYRMQQVLSMHGWTWSYVQMHRRFDVRH